MKLNYQFLAGAVLASAVSFSTWAADRPLPIRSPLDPSPTPLGAEKKIQEFTNILIKNFQDEPLGRIKDLGIDLANGRIVEVLVLTDASFGQGYKIVGVPPLALFPDLLNEVYRLNVTTEVFKSAAEIHILKWEEAGRSDLVAAAYRLFGQEPYFLAEGGPAIPGDDRPRVALGYVERASKIVDMPVGNFQKEKLGKVWSMTLDIPHGRIMDVIIVSPGNFKTKNIVPATALTFNAKHDGLMIDDSKMEFRDEPRYVLTEAAFGQEAYYERETTKGAPKTVALEQGNSYRDVDRTVLINKDIRAAKINGRNVEVGTINGRVTLRGWVHTDEDRRRIGEIAIAAARTEVVDNQITVGKPVTGK